jgi:uncharacterized protein YqgV (UPF0045/DUF77 family)
MKTTTALSILISVFLLNTVIIFGQTRMNADSKIVLKRKKTNLQDTVKTTIDEKTLKELSPYTGEYISLDFYHSLRIPNNHVSIKIENMNGKDVKIRVKSEPVEKYRQKWIHTIIDTTFNVSFSDFSKAVDKFKRVLSSDVCDVSVHDGMGADGTTFKLEYGNTNSSASYRVWTPNYMTEKRKLNKFVDCCETIIKLSDLKIKII